MNLDGFLALSMLGSEGWNGSVPELETFLERRRQVIRTEKAEREAAAREREKESGGSVSEGVEVERGDFVGDDDRGWSAVEWDGACARRVLYMGTKKA